MENYDNSWFPINKAMSLENMIIDNEYVESEKIKQIEDEINKAKKNVTDMMDTMSQIISRNKNKWNRSEYKKIKKSLNNKIIKQ